MKSIVKIVALSALMFTSLANAKSATGHQDVLLSQYFELAGVNSLLSSVPAQVQGMHQDAIEEHGADSADAKVLANLVSAWKQEEIKQKLIDSLSNSIGPSSLEQLVSWQKSSLAKVIKHQDMMTEQGDFEQEFILFAQRLPQSLPSKEKMELINQLIDSKELVNSMVDLTLVVSRPVLTAMVNTPSAKQEGLTLISIEQQLEELEQLLVPELSEQMAILSYYLYKDVAIEDLNAYVQFYQSDLGQLELSILNKVLHQSVVLWQENYGDNTKQEQHILGEAIPITLD